jgi:hypothetical protein
MPHPEVKAWSVRLYPVTSLTELSLVMLVIQRVQRICTVKNARAAVSLYCQQGYKPTA